MARTIKVAYNYEYFFANFLVCEFKKKKQNKSGGSTTTVCQIYPIQNSSPTKYIS